MALKQAPQYQASPSTRSIHKSDFIARMLPYWSDVRATREVDDTVDGYFEMFSHYKLVDMDDTKTVSMIEDMEQRVKVVVPGSEFSATALLVDCNDTELVGSSSMTSI